MHVHISGSVCICIYTHAAPLLALALGCVAARACVYASTITCHTHTHTHTHTTLDSRADSAVIVLPGAVAFAPLCLQRSNGLVTCQAFVKQNKETKSMRSNALPVVN